MLHPVVRGSPHIGRAQKEPAALSRPSPLPSVGRPGVFWADLFLRFLAKNLRHSLLQSTPLSLFSQGAIPPSLKKFRK